MIDTTREQPIPLSVAASETPNRKGGRGVSAATMWRWANHGIRGVRLDTVLIGGMRMTSREALQRFFGAATAASREMKNGRPEKTPRQPQ